MKDIRASIDIGSNSILLLVADFSNGFDLLENESNVTGLGKDLDVNKVFCNEAMDESEKILSEYSKLVKKHKLDPADVICTATEASRVAQNSKEFFNKIKIKTGIDVQIINGLAEAYFSTKGIMFNTEFDSKIIHIMDIGGASTEIIKVRVEDSKILQSFSMPIGSVRVMDWLEKGIFESKRDEILNNYQKELNECSCSELYCVAGTMTSVGNMHLKNKEWVESEVHGHKMESQVVHDLLQEHENTSVTDLLRTFPFLGKRAKTIVAGLNVAKTFINSLNVNNINISCYGLRYGTLSEGKISKEYLYE